MLLEIQPASNTTTAPIVREFDSLFYAGRDARIGPLGLGVSERLTADTVMLPLFHGMTRDEEEHVLSSIAEV